MRLSEEEIARLSPEERLELIEQLWNSLEPEDIPLTEWQKAELDRRLATLERDRENAITWEELKAVLVRSVP